MSSFTPNLVAAATMPAEQDFNKIYIKHELENRKPIYDVRARTRGKCTDTHSWEWCKNNGYENNRPVPGKVILTGKAAECYWFCIRKGLMASLTSLVSPAGGDLYAVDSVAEAFDKCDF
ncbi:MAG: hypothetical protein ACTJGH_02345 [Peptoniphilaceae bacterium]